MLSRMQDYLFIAPSLAIWPGLALWACAFAVYTAADALVGFFGTKEALVRLNE
jgi:ABC-type dipeptide/oligopeptide/nickel transport system permease subunit